MFVARNRDLLLIALITACGGSPGGTKPTTPSAASSRRMIGPVDLAAETVDLVALFPGASVVLYQDLTIVVDFGESGSLAPRVSAGFTVDKAHRIVAIEWDFRSPLKTPDGFATNMPMTALAQKYADITCVDVKLDAPDPLPYCSGPSTGGFHYLPNDGIQHPTPVRIADLTAGATIHSIRWVAPKSGGPRVLNVGSLKRPD